jgi:lysyl-tRNA synthetase, class II
LMTNQPSIQEVLFFPQMRPEKSQARDSADRFIKAGIPAEYVQLIQKSGYPTVESLSDANPNKLHQEICGLNKKHKLELRNPSIEEVKNWCGKS